jgi:hypothetical protein
MKKIVLLSVFILSFLIKVNSQQRDTSFSCVVSQIHCDAAVVHVQAYSVYNSYCWYFSDGKTYCKDNRNIVSHNFDNPGTYSVTFVGVWQGDTTTLTKKDIVTVYKPPKVSFDMQPYDSAVYPPYTVQLINKTIAGDGNLLKYKWTYQYDSIISNDTNTMFTFTKHETSSTIRLEVTDNNDCEETAFRTIFVKDTAQKREIDYIVGCGAPCDSLINPYILKDTVKVTGIIERNCCTHKTVTIDKRNDTIYIREWVIGEGCRCLCHFCFEINVPGITEDSIYVSFADSVYLAKRSLIINTKNPQAQESKMSIYPNPAESSFSLRFSDKIEKNALVQISDVLGNSIYSSHHKIRDEQVIDNISLSQGIYFIRINTDKGKTYSAKLVIK